MKKLKKKIRGQTWGKNCSSTFVLTAYTILGPFNIPPLSQACKLASQIEWYFFSSLVANTRPQSSAFISNLGQMESTFSISALTSLAKPLGLISTFAPIGMLDLS